MDLSTASLFRYSAGTLTLTILYSSMMGVQQLFFELPSQSSFEVSLDPLALNDLLNPTLSWVCTVPYCQSKTIDKISNPIVWWHPTPLYIPIPLHEAAGLPFLSGPSCFSIPNPIPPWDACSCSFSSEWRLCCPHPALIRVPVLTHPPNTGHHCMETEATWSNGKQYRWAIH